MICIKVDKKISIYIHNPQKYITATNRGTLTHYTVTFENVAIMLINHCTEFCLHFPQYRWYALINWLVYGICDLKKWNTNLDTGFGNRFSVLTRWGSDKLLYLNHCWQLCTGFEGLPTPFCKYYLKMKWQKKREWNIHYMSIL